MQAERTLEATNLFEPQQTSSGESISVQSGSDKPIESAPCSHNDVLSMPEILQQHNVPHELYERTNKEVKEISERMKESINDQSRKRRAWLWIVGLVGFWTLCLFIGMMAADSDFDILLFAALYFISLALCRALMSFASRRHLTETRKPIDEANTAFAALAEKESALYAQYGIKAECVFADLETTVCQQGACEITRKKFVSRFQFVETEEYLERKELEKLNDLFQDGALTKEEFELAGQIVKRSRGKQKDDISPSYDYDVRDISAQQMEADAYSTLPAGDIV